jgi:hypothetical protein
MMNSASDCALCQPKSRRRLGYRELTAQGKWSEAGKELGAIEAEVK